MVAPRSIPLRLASSATLTPDEAASVEALRQRVEAELAEFNDEASHEAKAHSDRLTLLRFVLARPTMEEAASMFVDSMRWRAQQGTSELFAEFHPSNATVSRRVEMARAHFYGNFGGVQRNTHPFFLERLGAADFATMVCCTPVWSAARPFGLLRARLVYCTPVWLTFMSPSR